MNNSMIAQVDVTGLLRGKIQLNSWYAGQDKPAVQWLFAILNSYKLSQLRTHIFETIGTKWEHKERVSFVSELYLQSKILKRLTLREVIFKMMKYSNHYYFDHQDVIEIRRQLPRLSRGYIFLIGEHDACFKSYDRPGIVVDHIPLEAMRFSAWIDLVASEWGRQLARPLPKLAASPLEIEGDYLRMKGIENEFLFP